jgi:hypothetical protein
MGGMSLITGLESPRTPLRQFLDRELSAGPRPLRTTFRAQDTSQHIIHPGPGVGYEAGTVGTAIDQRLRLAFTAGQPVDAATALGIAFSSRVPDLLSDRLQTVGDELTQRLADTSASLRLDDRDLPLDRAWEEEEALARMLLSAAWYAVAYRNPYAFGDTPLFLAACEDPQHFTLKKLLDLPHRDLVADVLAQLHHAADSDLAALRARTTPADCTPGPTFPDVDITADADLITDGMLLEFKSTRNAHHLSQHTAWQMLGYLLLDTHDHYRIDTLALYLTRSGTLAHWRIEDYLALLGARRRDLAELRAAVADLLAGCPADQIPYTPDRQRHARRLLQRLAPFIPPGHCPVCAQAVPPNRSGRPRVYCSRWCGKRACVLKSHGWLTDRR